MFRAYAPQFMSEKLIHLQKTKKEVHKRRSVMSIINRDNVNAKTVLIERKQDDKRLNPIFANNIA